MEFEHIIGLEVHAELSTKTKAYCSCKNEFGSPPNTNCCPVCMGFPGALPALNREVVNDAIRAGLALNCKIRKFSKQDRKNYFYPDMGKAYQITQYDLPLCYDGYLDIVTDGKERQIGITRIHIEEDAGKLVHDSEDGALLDFNRSGVPLIEVVTEPDLRSAEEAKTFLESLRNILVSIGITDGKMQEGSFRCDVNVSIREKGSTRYETRCEMKNINTFRGAQRAIEYEVARQERVVRAGGTIKQETRRWDDETGQNYIMRSKENANDYRYFPEVNVMPIVVDDDWIEAVRLQIPELPHEKKVRYQKEFKLPGYDANLLAASKPLADFFEKTVACGAEPKEAGNWCLGEVSRLLNERGMGYDAILISPSNLTKLIALIKKRIISGSAGKKVLVRMFDANEDPEKLVSEMGLDQVNDEKTLESWAEEVIRGNLQTVKDYQNGKSSALSYLIGQVMKKSHGRANPQTVSKILQTLLTEYN